MSPTMPPTKYLHYPSSEKFYSAIGPYQNLAREDFILIGVGLRLAAFIELLDGHLLEGIKLSNPSHLARDVEMLRRKAEKFQERYDLNPKDFHGSLPARKRG